MFFKKRLRLRQFEVWHNWTFYSIEPIADLHQAARHLIGSGLCEIAFHTDEVVYWRSDKGVKTSEVPLCRAGLESRCTFSYPEGLDTYQAEHLYAAIEMRFEEIKNWTHRAKDNISYVRAFMTPCVFEHDGLEIILYPQLKIYSNGVITLAFRILGTEAICTSDELIQYVVQVTQSNTASIKVNPAIIIWDQRAWLYKKQGILARFRQLRVQAAVPKFIHSASTTEIMGDFSHPLVSLDPRKTEKEYNFGTLVEYIYHAILTALEPPRAGWKYVLFGPKSKYLDIGEYIGGFPNIYIMRAEDHSITASQIRKDYGADLGRIMMGITSDLMTDRAARIALPKTLRPLFEDWTVHLNDAQALWMYSKQGFGDDEGKPISHQNSLVYRLQPKAEFIHYIYLSYRRLEHRSAHEVGSTKEILDLRFEEHQLNHVSHHAFDAGELEQLCEYAWRAFKIPHIQSLITQNLELHGQQLREVQEARIHSVSLILAFVFGIVGAAQLSTDVIGRLWNSLGWWTPAVPDQRPMFFFTITTVGLSLLYLFLSVTSRFFLHLKGNGKVSSRIQ